MAADVGIAVKGAGVGTATTASGTSQTTGSTFYIFGVWDSFSNFTSVADNKSNSYTEVGTEFTAGSMKSRLYSCVNGAGGAGHTATFVVTGGGQPTVFLVEATGCDTSSPGDQSNRRSDNSSPYTLAAGLTTTQAKELLLSFFGGDSGSNPTTIAEGGLGSSTVVVSEANGSANWTGAVAKSYKTATGTFNPSWTSSGAGNGAVYLETLKEAVSASPATLSSPTPSGTIGTTTTASPGASTDQTSGTGYVVVDTDANISGITAAQVKAGQNNASAAAVASANATISASPFTIGVSGLTADTAYGYAVAQNNTDGDSNVVTGTFTTATESIATNQRLTLLGVS